MVGGNCVEKTPDIGMPSNVQDHVRSPIHEGTQEHTQSSPIPRSLSQCLESLSDVSDSTLHPLEVGSNQDNLVDAFKRIMDSQEEFPDITFTPLDAQTDNFDELFHQLESTHVSLDLIQMIKDDSFTCFLSRGCKCQVIFLTLLWTSSLFSCKLSKSLDISKSLSVESRGELRL